MFTLMKIMGLGDLKIFHPMLIHLKVSIFFLSMCACLCVFLSLSLFILLSVSLSLSLSVRVWVCVCINALWFLVLMGTYTEYLK